MKVRLIRRQGQRGIEVTVVAAPDDDRVDRIIDGLRSVEGRLSGYPDGASAQRRVVPLAEVSRIRTQGDHAQIALTDGTTLQSAQRLFELEAALKGTGFVRVSRQELVNLDNVLTIRPEFGSRLALGLEGGYDSLVTRSYVPEVRRALGAVG